MNSESFKRLLDPVLLREAVISGAIFSLCFEVVQDQVIARPKEAHSFEFDEDGPVVGEAYQKEVRSRHKKVVNASLDWLREQNVLTEEDVSFFLLARHTRNKIAHEMHAWLGEKELSDEEFRGQLFGLVDLLKKIEVWWTLAVEIPANPDFDGQEVSESDIEPGSVIMLKMFITVALGNKEESQAYLKYMKERGV